MPQISTTIPQPQMTYDAAAARLSLARGVSFAIGGTAMVLAGLLVLAERPDWWRGYKAATVASVLAAGLSLFPLNNGIRKGFSALIPAVMLATGVRTLVVVAGCMVAVAVGSYPPVPTFTLMLPYYFALLGVETACLLKLGKK